jgi:glycosyltransferase involved in cell wall biosynthesis
MNILIVNTRHYYGGGDSTYTFNLADLLRSHGHDVAFFGMQDDRNLPDPNSDLFVSHIDFRDLNQRKNPITGFKVMARSIYSTEARRRFACLLDRFQPDIVHLQNIHAHISPSVIIEARKRGIPVVWTLHDYKQVCPNSTFMIDRTHEICEACRGGRFYQPMIKRCKKNSLLACTMVVIEAYSHQLMRVRQRVNAYLAPSAFMFNKLLENGFDPQKTHHLPLFVPQSLLGEPDLNQPMGVYFLFLGRLDIDKGIYPLIEACRLVPRAKVVLAGRVEEPIKSDLIDHLPENVRYVGMKTGVELDELRRNSLAFVLPSLWYENQPFSVLEAFAYGKPVIASRLGGISELVGDDERGILVPPANPGLLAAAMEQAVQNPDMLMEKGHKARKYVIANHSPETHYAHLFDIYQKVTQEKKA